MNIDAINWTIMNVSFLAMTKGNATDKDDINTCTDPFTLVSICVWQAILIRLHLLRYCRGCYGLTASFVQPSNERWRGYEQAKVEVCERERKFVKVLEIFVIFSTLFYASSFYYISFHSQSVLCLLPNIISFETWFWYLMLHYVNIW